MVCPHSRTLRLLAISAKQYQSVRVQIDITNKLKKGWIFHCP